MDRSDQLFYCKQCIHRKMDMKQGLICNLTGEKASFQDECSDFKQDETTKKIVIDDTEALETDEIKGKLSPEIIDKLKLEQKLLPGVIAGVVVGILGAILWGIITVVTGFQIGYMAIAIGAIVGIAVRNIGNGIDKIFGYSGAIIAFLSVVLGNFLSIVGFIANANDLKFFETLVLIDYSYLPELMAETFNVMDLLFYGLAITAGYKFSFRKITEKDILNLKSANS